MAVDNVIRNRIAVWLEIESEDAGAVGDIVDITSCTIRYARNSIPTATNINVTIGTDVTSKKQTTNIIQRLKRYARLSIKLAVFRESGKAKPVAGPGGATYPDLAYINHWPANPGDGIVIFTGSSSSVSFNAMSGIDGNNVSYSINCIGFLNDLAGTPTNSRAFGPFNPTDPAKNSRMLFKPRLGDAPLKRGQSVEAQFLQRFAKGLRDDFWKKGVRELLAQVSDRIEGEDTDTPARSLLDATATGAKSGGTDEGINGNSETVINPTWMSYNGEDTATFSKFVTVTSGGTTVQAGTNVIKPADFSRTLAIEMGTAIYGSWWAQTAWASIINSTRQFYMSTIPTIEAYAVVPFTPNLSGEPFITIYADEYDAAGISSPVKAPVRRLALMAAPTGHQYIDESRGPKTDKQRKQILLGVWPPAGESPLDTPAGDKPNRAETRFLIAPSWVDGRSSKVGYRNVKNFKEYFKKDLADGNTNAQVLETFRASNIGTSYAQLAYFDAIFGGGNAVISGHLRFDIGPGSLVEVEAALDIEGESSDPVFGTVESVELSININAGGGGDYRTTYTISYTRNKEDQENVGIYTAETHPIYGSAWKGTPLMKDPGSPRTDK